MDREVHTAVPGVAKKELTELMTGTGTELMFYWYPREHLIKIMYFLNQTEVHLHSGNKNDTVSSKFRNNSGA